MSRRPSISTQPVYYNNNDNYMENKNCRNYKVITLGNAGIGKSTLISTFCHGNFHEGTAVQIVQKFIKRETSLLQLDIWDTAGQERYDSITHNYYRNAHGCLLCFDLSDEQSFADVKQWFDKLHHRCKDDNSTATHIPTLLVGTKSDLRQSSGHKSLKPAADCQLAASGLGLTYIEVSREKPASVERAFEKLIDMMDKCFIKNDLEISVKISSPCYYEKTEIKKVCKMC